MDFNDQIDWQEVEWWNAETAREAREETAWYNRVKSCIHDWQTGMMVVSSEDIETVAEMRRISGEIPPECSSCGERFNPSQHDPYIGFAVTA